MKNKLITLTATLATLAALAAPAKAGDRGDKVAAALGGFIGGVIVGANLDRHDHRSTRVVVTSPPPCAPEVVVVHNRPHGHWETVTTRVWVPARWVVSYDSCGRRIRTQVGGCYEDRSQRVWVDSHHGHGGRVIVASGPRRW
ncbi:MAG TPA: hypothetical protein PLN52_08240 [Opitutaceae bacterium]|nr:hypothetical protein [Opitutaceae bacterium]